MSGCMLRPASDYTLSYILFIRNECGFSRCQETTKRRPGATLFLLLVRKPRVRPIWGSFFSSFRPA
jgi:hypothetical protein